MAQKVTTIVDITDDIDGTPNAKTVKFGLDDKQYSIDLSPENEKKLREFLAVFVGHATQSGRKTGRTKGPRSTSRSMDIRDWARSNGYDVPERGRISQNIVDAYDAAQAAGSAPVPVPSSDPIDVAVAFEPAPAALS